MKNKIFYKVIFGVAVFMVVVVAISVFGLFMLGISAVQAMLAQKGLPEWNDKVTESDLWNFEICCAIHKAIEALKE